MKSISFYLGLLLLLIAGSASAALYNPLFVWEKQEVSYYFFKDSRQKHRVQKFNAAIDFIHRAIGRKVFVPTNDYKNSDIRIQYLPEKENTLGNSKIGNFALKVEKTKPTMKFFVEANANPSMNTILHELVHALGISHEHQSPQSLLFSKYDAKYRFLEPQMKELMEEFGYDESDRDNILQAYSPYHVYYSLFDPLSIMDYSFVHENLSKESFSDAIGLNQKLIGEEELYLSPMDIAQLRYLYNEDFKKKHTTTHRVKLSLSDYKTSKSDSFSFKIDKTSGRLSLVIDLKHPLFLNTKMMLSPILLANSEISVNRRKIQNDPDINYNNIIFDNMVLGKNIIEFDFQEGSLPAQAFTFDIEFVEMDYMHIINIAKRISKRFVNPVTIWFDRIEEKLRAARRNDLSDGGRPGFNHYLFNQLKKLYRHHEHILNDPRTAITIMEFGEEHAKNIKNLFSDFLISIKDNEDEEDFKLRLMAAVDEAPETLDGYVLAKTILLFEQEKSDEALKYFIDNQNFVSSFSVDVREYLSKFAFTDSKEFFEINNRVFQQASNLGASDFDYFLLGVNLAKNLEDIYKNCFFSEDCTRNKLDNMDTILSKQFSILKPKTLEQLSNFWRGLNGNGSDSWNLSHLVAKSLANLLPHFTPVQILQTKIQSTQSFKILETYHLLGLTPDDVYDLSIDYQFFEVTDFKPRKVFEWNEPTTSETEMIRELAGSSTSVHAYLTWTWWNNNKIYMAAGSFSDSEPILLRKKLKNIETLVNEVVLKPCNPSALKGYDYNYNMMTQSWFYPLRFVFLQSTKQFVKSPQSFCKPRFKTTAEFYNYTKLMEALYEYK